MKTQLYFLLGLVMITVLPVDLFSQTAIKISNGSMDKIPIDKVSFESILYSNSGIFYTTSNSITDPSLKQAGTRYCKGFKVLSEHPMNQVYFNQLKGILLSPGSYRTGVSRSCYFLPDIGIELNSGQNSNTESKTIILLSRKCRTIYISHSINDYNGEDGGYFDLSVPGYENINDFFETLKDPLFDFKQQKINSKSKSNDENRICDQILLLELLIERNDYEAIKFLNKARFFLIMDSLYINNNRLKKLNLVLDKNEYKDDFQILDSLKRTRQIEQINQLITGKIISVTLAPQFAAYIDNLPKPNSTRNEILAFYLEKIKKIINSNQNLKKTFSIDDFLASEQKEDFTRIEDQIKYRQDFIAYLLRKY
jgi:hypothetical protein